MLNKLTALIRQYQMIQPGDMVTCAVSGGADSIALLFALYLLRDKLGFSLAAAHFNHQLRGEESQRDEDFVRDFCARFHIPLSVGTCRVTAGEKGLEAAAREARYAFFRTLPGKIATAHTADDNAETVLLHLVRGTGLKGLGAIAPVRDNLIRPMLLVTREEVLAFLRDYSLPHVEDSSNQTDRFLRNRLRRHVMPLLTRENPKLAENLSAMALRLREDEDALSQAARDRKSADIFALRTMPKALRCRILGDFLAASGVTEPEAQHISLAEALVFSDTPSARADFPGGVTIARRYSRLEAVTAAPHLAEIPLPNPGCVELPQLGLRVVCRPAAEHINTPAAFTTAPVGQIVLRSRKPGDEIRLSGGTKSLKKLWIDRKIPAGDRPTVPIIADDLGILGVYGIGGNLDRAGAAVEIRFEPIHTSDTL